MKRAEVMKNKKAKKMKKMTGALGVTILVLVIVLVIVACAKSSLLPPSESELSEAKSSESVEPSGSSGSTELTSDATESGSDGSTEASEAETASGTEDSESQTEPESSEVMSETETTPPPAITIPDDELKTYSGIYVVGNTAYESYYYGQSAAENYAEAVTTAADKLSGRASVYDIIIPTSVGITFPDNYRKKIKDSNQQTSINKIIDLMGSKVINVPLYDTMMQHRDEYLYFRTDHHWTQLGAYYAYTQYCAKKGIQAYALDSYEVKTFDGFLGTLYNNTKDERLSKTPDTVYAYYPHNQSSMTYTDKKGNVVKWQVIADATNYKKGSKYLAFIGGDQPYEEIKNQSLSDGSACVVIKESFGNAYVPFMVDHYETVYVIDYRYWEGSLYKLVEEKGISDVIFINNIGMTRSKSLVNNLKKLVDR